MTTARLVYVMCDGDLLPGGRDERCPNLSPDADNAREALRLARRQGWVRTRLLPKPDGRPADLCPRCYAALAPRAVGPTESETT